MAFRPVNLHGGSTTPTMRDGSVATYGDAPDGIERVEGGASAPQRVACREGLPGADRFGRRSELGGGHPAVFVGDLKASRK
jgi:hypothetical protein